jgi:uncharacterized protein YprB with RNaseH-like and TPR domain
MPTPRPWTDDDDQLLVVLTNRKGTTQASIAKILGRTETSVNTRIYRLRQEGIKIPVLWFEKEDVRIASLDLETTNFVADAGLILTWALHFPATGEIKYGCITKKEMEAGTFDKRIIKELLEELAQVDVILTYYGTGFDIPFLRSRVLYWGLQMPTYGSIHHFDLFYAARSLFKLHRKSLDAVTVFLGIQGKTHLLLDVWNRARYGDKKALEYVLEHNKQDVEILSQLWERVKPYRKWTKRSI